MEPKKQIKWKNFKHYRTMKRLIERKDLVDKRRSPFDVRWDVYSGNVLIETFNTDGEARRYISKRIKS